MLYNLHLKRILTLWPFLILIIICQVAFGFLSSFALRDQSPQLILAVYTEDHGDSYVRFKQNLEAIPELALVETDSEASAKRLAESQQALGAVIIDKDLKSRVTKGRNAVRFIPAPGSSGGLVVKEHVAAAIVALRAEDRYRREIEGLGGTTVDLQSVYEPVLSVEYLGPPLLASQSGLTPEYGLPALFVLILTLLGALSLPGPDSKRTLLQGSVSLITDFFSGIAALLTLEVFILSIFFLSCHFIYDAPPTITAIFSFAALSFYCVTFGGLIAALRLRRLAVWIFIPWLLLNMTLGGGLWGISFSNSVTRFLLPLAPALTGSMGYYSSVVYLTGAAVFFLIVCVIILSTCRNYGSNYYSK
jgi:hypothetical protein